jgi:hypothetical protein
MSVNPVSIQANLHELEAALKLKWPIAIADDALPDDGF